MFDSVGWTPNDLSLFQDFYFLDENTYSVENLRKLSAYFPRFGWDKNPGFTLAQKLSSDTTKSPSYSSWPSSGSSPGVPTVPWA